MNLHNCAIDLTSEVKNTSAPLKNTALKLRLESYTPSPPLSKKDIIIKLRAAEQRRNNLLQSKSLKIDGISNTHRHSSIKMLRSDINEALNAAEARRKALQKVDIDKLQARDAQRKEKVKCMLEYQATTNDIKRIELKKQQENASRRREIILQNQVLQLENNNAKRAQSAKQTKEEELDVASATRKSLEDKAHAAELRRTQLRKNIVQKLSKYETKREQVLRRKSLELARNA